VVDSDFALFHLQRALWDPVDPEQLGSLREALHYRVNGEVYRFASQRTLRRFVEAPHLWCGMLRDPVTGERFWPSSNSPEAYWVGGPYFFASDSTKAAFVADPKKFEVVRTM
jgi:YHS domain-containing protein